MLGNSNSGFTLTEVLVAVAISSIVVFGTGTLITKTAKTGVRAERQFWLEARRLEIQNLIRSPSGWTAIQTANPHLLSCLNSGMACASYTSPQALNLPIDGAILDGSSPTIGMTSKGDFCTTFDATNGNATCPIGVFLRWQIICDNGACLHGQPKISIQFQAKDPSGEVNENLKVYDIVSYKDPKLESLGEVCTAMGGTISLIDGISCTLPQLTSACNPAAGSFVLGFDNLGRPNCGKPNPGGCASTDAAMGFNAAGGITCAPACP